MAPSSSRACATSLACQGFTSLHLVRFRGYYALVFTFVLEDIPGSVHHADTAYIVDKDGLHLISLYVACMVNQLFVGEQLFLTWQFAYAPEA